LDHLPEILPDGTVIKGHQRIRAVEARGDTHLDVIVRYDLADDPVRADREFLEDNLLGRQLSNMQKARGYLALLEVHKKEPRDPLAPRANPLRQLADELGVSQKTVKRYVDAARGPLEVQVAFDRREVKLEHAARVGRLSREEQELMAEAIRNGESAMTVVARYVGTPVRKKNRTAEQFQHLMRTLDAAAVLDGQPLPEDIIVGEPELDTLDKGRRLIDGLDNSIRELIKSREQNIAQLSENVETLCMERWARPCPVPG
jgi:ParB-like chromosome segregation protein Spo0J